MLKVRFYQFHNSHFMRIVVKGRRPSFDRAAKGEIAKPLYELFNKELEGYGIVVETGIFGADMKVKLIK